MYSEIRQYTDTHHVTLVAVSKTRTADQILALYNLGQRDFGENRVQELMDKKDALPSDIQWHLIGHLQKNKVRYIAPFISMIHSIDSPELLETVDREAKKTNAPSTYCCSFTLHRKKQNMEWNSAKPYPCSTRPAIKP